MSKKHFEAAAKQIAREVAEISKLRSQDARVECREHAEHAAIHFAELFQQFNPRFNRQRFMEACGL